MLSETKLRELFDDESIVAIKRIIIPTFPKQDKLVWILDSNRKFFVRSAFKSTQTQPPSDPNANWKSFFLWKSKLQERHKMLIWRIASEILPTRTVAAHKLGLGDTSCPLCLDCKESIVHLFLKCLVSRAIWFGLRWAIHSSQFMVTNNKDIIKMVCDPPIIVEPYSSSNCLKDHTTIQFSNTLDFIWNLRN